MLVTLPCDFIAVIQIRYCEIATTFLMKDLECTYSPYLFLM